MLNLSKAAIGLLILGYAGTWIDHAAAQPDPDVPPPGMMTPPFGPRHAGWMHPPMDGLMQSLALVFDAPDKQLTAADVQKIAEAFLLLQSNHTWKVLNVQPDGETIRFQIATEQNAVVASFAVNRHTAHLERLVNTAWARLGPCG